MNRKEWIARKRVELGRAPKLETRNITPSIRDFSYAIATQRRSLSVIAEIARATPEDGALNASIEVPALARRLDQAGVSAIAVATDAVACRGSAADLTTAAGAVSIPIASRDLILESQQIYRARLAGADAVLLTLGASSPSDVRIFLELAGAMHLSAPVEVDSVGEVEIALSVGARILVIPAFGPDGSLNLELSAPLLAKIPRNVSTLVRGPFSRPEELTRLYGFADGIWTAAPLARAPDDLRWLKSLVEAADSP